MATEVCIFQQVFITGNFGISSYFVFLLYCLLSCIMLCPFWCRCCWLSFFLVVVLLFLVAKSSDNRSVLVWIPEKLKASTVKAPVSPSHYMPISSNHRRVPLKALPQVVKRMLISQVITIMFMSMYLCQLLLFPQVSSQYWPLFDNSGTPPTFHQVGKDPLGGTNIFGPQAPTSNRCCCCPLPWGSSATMRNRCPARQGQLEGGTAMGRPKWRAEHVAMGQY